MLSNLTARIIPIEDLKLPLIKGMYNLFIKYYDHVSFENFQSDLMEKDHVILLLKKNTREVKGFSTICSLELEVKGKNVRGMFSGDTVVDKEFWGQGTLGVAFLRHLLIQKIKKPLTPLFWFLISKGHKTYLLMANNFSTHYPRFERETPKGMQLVIDGFSKLLYGDYYNNETGLISYPESKNKDALKVGVTPITEEMKRKNPRIAFFSQQNPEWQRGDELACVAEMTFALPIQYLVKTINKNVKRQLKKIGKRKTVQSLAEKKR